MQWNDLTLPPLNLWNYPKKANTVAHHYTTLGNIPVVLEYEYVPRQRIYDDEDGTYEITPSYVRIYEVYVDKNRSKGIQSFAYWQIDAWEREISNLLEAGKSSIYTGDE